MRVKSTARSLFLSVIATILCVLMLLSATFAWYNVSKTSGNNVVKTGAFDVDFEWSDDFEDWDDFDSTSQLFNEITLLPGEDTGVKYIKVTNNNTYGVTFSASLIEKTVTDGNSDLKFYSKVVEETATVSELKAETATPLVNAATFVDYQSVPAKANNVPGTLIVALLIALPGDSEAENVQADFQILLSAFQSHDGAKVSRTVTNGEVSVVIPNSDAASVYAVEVSDKSITDSAASMNITVTKDGNPVPAADGPFTVTVFIDTGRNIMSVTHNGDPVGDFMYNASTGYLTFTTTGFSPFVVTYTTNTTMQDIAEAGVVADVAVLSIDDPAIQCDPENDSSYGITPEGKIRFLNAPVSATEQGASVNLAGAQEDTADVDAVMEFTADQAPGTELGEFGSYITDFFVSFDCAIPDSAVTLYGGYGDLGWFGFSNTGIPIQLGQSVPLLGLMNIGLPYSTVVNDVKDFMCAIDIDFTNIPAEISSVTVTLKLVMINPENCGTTADYMNPGNHNVVFSGDYVIARS